MKDKTIVGNPIGVRLCSFGYNCYSAKALRQGLMLFIYVAVKFYPHIRAGNTSLFLRLLPRFHTKLENTICIDLCIGILFRWGKDHKLSILIALSMLALLGGMGAYENFAPIANVYGRRPIHLTSKLVAVATNFGSGIFAKMDLSHGNTSS